MAVIVIALDGRVLDRPVHPFDLPVGPGVVDPGEAMLDAIVAAAHREHMCDVASCRAFGAARRKAELNAVIGQNRVDLVGNGSDQGDEEGPSRHPVGALDQLHEGELARPIDGHEQVELALGGLNLGEVDMEEADRVGLGPFLRLLVALDLRQAADVVPLKAAEQR